jgi:hypothetical protein
LKTIVHKNKAAPRFKSLVLTTSAQDNQQIHDGSYILHCTTAHNPFHSHHLYGSPLLQASSASFSLALAGGEFHDQGDNVKK